MSRARVSVIVPCRNEGRAIDAFLENVRAQADCGHELEVLIAEGRSTDDTRARLEDWQRLDPRVKVLDNPEGTVAPGLNRAICAATGDIIVRMDVHTEYDADYIKECVEALARSGAQNVGGPWRAVGRPGWQEAIALAFNSPFAVGGARGHKADYEGPVDTVYLGCWRRSTLLELGLFDTELTRNQDDELNLRLTRRGGLIWQSPRVRSQYHPRGRLRDLFRQYTQYGYWKVRVIQKHRLPASVRHIVPAAFLVAVVLSALFAPFHMAGAVALALLSGSYAVAAVGASVITCSRARRWSYLPRMPAVFASFHFGYGFGFLVGVWDFLIRRGRGASRHEQLTRS